MRKTENAFVRLDLRRYEDKYVSLVDGKVAASDDDPEIAYQKAKRRHPKKEVVLWKVVHGETFVFTLAGTR